jgi:hypothetical protein
MYFGNQIYETFGSGPGSRGGGSTSSRSTSSRSTSGGVGAIYSRKSDNDVLDDKQENPFYFPFYSNEDSRAQNNNSNEASNDTNIFNRSCGMCGMVEVV